MGSDPVVPGRQAVVGAFASDLRQLGEGKATIDELLDDARKHRWDSRRHGGTTPSRSALFAATAGTALPTASTLAFLVKGWADGGDGNRSQRGRQIQRQIDDWEERRARLQRSLRRPRGKRAESVKIEPPPEQKELGELLRKRFEKWLPDLAGLSARSKIDSTRLQRYLDGLAIPGDSAVNALIYVPPRPGAKNLTDTEMAWWTRLEWAVEKARHARANERRRARAARSTR